MINLVIVAKTSDGQRYPLPLIYYLIVCDGESGSGLIRTDDVHFGCLALNEGFWPQVTLEGVARPKRGFLVLPWESDSMQTS